MNRKERRLLLKAEKLGMLNLGNGYGIGNPNPIPATGQTPQVNPFMIPKNTGLDVISKTFPNNYFTVWDLTTARLAYNQARDNGYPISYAALASWVFESSPFIQSIFNQIESTVSNTEIFYTDEKGNIDEITSKLFTNERWFKELCKEIALSFMWGFTCINFDPIGKRCYKYPMQNIDPINKMIRNSTFNLFDGFKIDEKINLLYIQPSSSYERFLGYMQPISRMFVQMNQAQLNWLAASRRAAYPALTIGYPQNDIGLDGEGAKYNQFEQQAENIAANWDTSKGLVYPYTINPDGTIQKSLNIEFEGGKSPANAYKIFMEFNQEAKDEIMQMVWNETLTTMAGKNGSRSLGEVHEDKHKHAEKSFVEFVLNELNDNFLPKIKQFYKNFPNTGRFDINRAKKYSIEEVIRLSAIMAENGKKLTNVFFEEMGLQPDFFEDSTMPVEPPKNEFKKVEKSSIFNLLKKKL